MRVTKFGLTPRHASQDTAQLQPGRRQRAQTVRAPGFPARVSLVAVGTVEFEPAEQGRRYQLRLELLDQAQRWIGHYERVLAPQPAPDTPGAPVRVRFVQPVDELVIPAEGTYTLQVVVDGTLLSSHLVRARADMAA
jgi:hypothetical protein